MSQFGSQFSSNLRAAQEIDPISSFSADPGPPGPGSLGPATPLGRPAQEPAQEQIELTPIQPLQDEGPPKRTKVIHNVTLPQGFSHCDLVQD
eukprot:10449955-Karenia_brevis.AAC.1